MSVKIALTAVINHR